ncbi:Protein MAINTENANCE OF MERISTEMS [Glycine max]|nr:Protein MAINTENANCE OF MERISTEMS [Glycine max]
MGHTYAYRGYERFIVAEHWTIAAQAYLLHLLGCTLFSNKSATQMHVVLLDAFRDLSQSGSYAWGVAALVHMYDNLNDACKSGGRQLAGYITLLLHFSSIVEAFTDSDYDERSSRACRWTSTKALPASMYRKHLHRLTTIDVCWMSYGDHRVVQEFDLISCFSGHIRWGLIVVIHRPERVTIFPHCAGPRLCFEDIDDRWMHFSYYLALVGQICVVPGQYASYYMYWFYMISHPFLRPTQPGDPPRHPPVMQDETYVELDMPEFLVAATSMEEAPVQAPSDAEQPRHAMVTF